MAWIYFRESAGRAYRQLHGRREAERGMRMERDECPRCGGMVSTDDDAWDAHVKFECDSSVQEDLKLKRTHIELGVSLALLWCREALAKVEKLDHVDADMGGFAYTIQEGSLVYLRSIESMLAQENLEAIMQTARLEGADGN